MGAMLGQAMALLIGSELKARVTGELPPVGAGKGLIHSTTVYGVLVLLAPALARWWGWHLDDAALQALAEALVTAAGALLAIYGRIRASRRIG